MPLALAYHDFDGGIAPRGHSQIAVTAGGEILVDDIDAHGIVIALALYHLACSSFKLRFLRLYFCLCLVRCHSAVEELRAAFEHGVADF